MAFDPVSLGVSAGVSALGGGLFGGGDDSAGKPREFDASNNLFDIIFNRTKGPDQMLAQATGPLADFQNQQLGAAGEFGGMAQDNAGADLARSLGMDFLGGLGAFDPYEIAQMQYDLLSPQLLEQQQQDRLSQEGRLFAQGQLFGTGGAQSQEALYGAQEDARQRMLADSFGQGLAAQSQQANLGSSLLQLDPSLRGLFQNLSGSALQNVLGIDAAGLERLRTGAMVEGASSTAPSAPGAGQYVGAGLLNAGVQGLGQNIDQLFTNPGYGNATWASP